jgi:hypothetical protein
MFLGPFPTLSPLFTKLLKRRMKIFLTRSDGYWIKSEKPFSLMRKLWKLLIWVLMKRRKKSRSGHC